MASSYIQTLLPLDDYARIMAIPGWAFNQVDHPGREYHGGCSGPIFQSGYDVDPTQFVGRDQVARAISTAERQIAGYLGYWPAPRWICDDEVAWPVPKRGVQVFAPHLKTTWGYIIEPGIEALDLVKPDCPVEYSDEDGDGYLDTGTITIGGLYPEEFDNECELFVVPAGYDRRWRIRTLDVEMGDDIVLTGPRWLFVDPPEWRSTEAISMDEDEAFLDYVDIYRQYNDSSTQADIIWKGDELCTDEICESYTQEACMDVLSYRTGIVIARPGEYLDGVWTRNVFTRCEMPTHASLWYLSGYSDDACDDCSMMGPTMKEAIVRLANVYLPAMPCSCNISQDKWKEDRMELEVGSYAVALAQRRLGTTARGAVFAMSVISSLEPLGRGG